MSFFNNQINVSPLAALHAQLALLGGAGQVTPRYAGLPQAQSPQAWSPNIGDPSAALFGYGAPPVYFQPLSAADDFSGGSAAPSPSMADVSTIGGEGNGLGSGSSGGGLGVSSSAGPLGGLAAAAISALGMNAPDLGVVNMDAFSNALSPESFAPDDASNTSMSAEAQGLSDAATAADGSTDGSTDGSADGSGDGSAGVGGGPGDGGYASGGWVSGMGGLSMGMPLGLAGLDGSYAPVYGQQPDNFDANQGHEALGALNTIAALISMFG